MAGDTTHVKGLSELGKNMQQFPGKVQKNLLRRGLRRGMNVVKPVAQANIRSVSGELANGLKVGTRSKGGTVSSYLKVTGPHAFVGLLLELTGAKAHQITVKVAKALGIGGRAYRTVNHPGFAKRPFMRRALDQQAQPAVIVVGEYLKEQLSTQHGIDTSYIMIEGDE